MYKQQFSLDNLVELKENEEKEKSKLPYKKYLENLLYLANADNSSIYSFTFLMIAVDRMNV
mgnify:CR=1 FL=1